MRATVQKWGNSLALRIPRPFAREVRLENNSPVEMTLEEGKLVVRPTDDSRLTQEALLAGVTRKNLHGEVFTGHATGREVC